MSTTKVNADVLDLTDDYAFTGTVTGAAGGWTFVSAVTASSSATVSFTGMATGYDYMLDGFGITPATNSVTGACVLGVTGPTYRTSSYDSMGGGFNTTGGVVSIGAITSQIQLTHTNQGNVTDESMAFSLQLYDPAGSADTYYTSTGMYTDASGNRINGVWGGHYTTAEAHTAIKFSFSSGNIAIGTFKLYKRANA